jgi:N-acetylmuramoyl-L-alanine amidase
MVRTFARGWLLLPALLISFVATAPAAPVADDRGLADLREWGRSYGLQVSWPVPGRQLRLQSQWTTLEFEAGSREASWNGIRLFLGEPVQRRGASLAVSHTDLRTILRPLVDPAAGPARGDPRLVMIDAGHGGSDPGTENRALKMQEKTFTLDVARRLKADLERRGFRVMMVRTADVRLSSSQETDLKRRAAAANRAGADLFISIHFNSLPGNTVTSGVETYALTPAGQRSTAAAARVRADRAVHPGNRQDHWNAVLAAAVHRRLLTRLGAVDRGLKRARFAVLREVRCPAILVEAGFLSNQAEARRVATPAHRQNIAEAIADGIGDYAAQARRTAPADKG